MTKLMIIYTGGTVGMIYDEKTDRYDPSALEKSGIICQNYTDWGIIFLYIRSNPD